MAERVVLQQILAGHRDAEERLGLVVRPWIRARSERMRGRVAELGVPVVGDLGDLEPRDVPGTTPDRLDPATLLRTAEYAIGGIHRQWPELAADTGRPADPETAVDALADLLRARMAAPATTVR